MQHKQIMNDQDGSSVEASDLQIKIQNCLLKALKSSQYLFDAQILEEIRLKIEEINNADSVVSSIEYFLFSLINKLHIISQRTHKLEVNTEDYQNLQNCVQKAEAQIRKHIRLEQQLKLYMDGLEDRIQQLQKELKLETKKYHQLFQSAKSLDLEKRELKKKLKLAQLKPKMHEKQIRVISQKASKILLSEPSLYQTNSNPYYVPSSTEKYKMMRHKKSTDKSQQLSKQRSNISQKKLLDNDIHVSLNDSPHKKRSVQQGVVISKNQQQFTKTIHLKQGYRKNSRKLMKYSTDQTKNKKQIRCNSVCQ